MVSYSAVALTKHKYIYSVVAHSKKKKKKKID